MIDAVLIFFWSFLVSVFSIPSIIFVSHIKKLLDEPNLRTMHESLTPRLGGLSIFAGFMSALTIFGTLIQGVQQLLAGCLILFFIGLKDDIVSVSAFKKFFVQILATGIVLFIGDVRITDFQGFLGIYELEPGLSYAFTFLVIIGVTNSINLIDGIDGLAGSIVLLISLVLAISFFDTSNVSLLAYSLVAFALAGSVLGFLRYNFHKAIIFMGDTGSLVCGFIIAVLSVRFVEVRPVQSSPALAIAILWVPLLDTLRVFTLRILSGASPFAPDKNHVHHYLIRLGLSQIQVILLLISINLMLVAGVWYFNYLGNTYLLLFLFAFSFLFSVVLEFFKKRPITTV
jgi:UDP-GlcNAc:undecaprenyl-phosphate/decaprenyl-phosphate GlcNAc-1-phosphate transferase